jgi:triacylglycerol esterase/lipase EstA (alpha/beta hydrolase family)
MRCQLSVGVLPAALLALLAALLFGTASLVPAGTAGAASAPSSGYNNWSCVPSAAHPYPVVLLHGLGATYYEDLGTDVAPYLEAAGYCVYGATYGATSPLGPYVGGLGDISASGTQIAVFVDQVLASTHAAKVDLVGHSEGAFMSLWVPKEDGLAGQIAKVVAIAPPTHGTTFGGAVTLGQLFGVMPEVDALMVAGGSGCVACSQLIVGGSAVATLDAGAIAQPGVSYTIIASRTDELVTPTSTAFVEEPGVQNSYIQSTCPFDPVGHIGEAYDSDVEEMIANALDPVTAVPVVCSFGLPF